MKEKYWAIIYILSWPGWIFGFCLMALNHLILGGVIFGICFFIADLGLFMFIPESWIEHEEEKKKK